MKRLQRKQQILAHVGVLHTYSRKQQLFMA
jgi:hypothetical protein